MNYFNNIKNEETKYKYRFKTREEFESEFGEFWSSNNDSNYRISWIDSNDSEYGMNKFFGIDLKVDEPFEKSFEENQATVSLPEPSGGHWAITINMLIENTIRRFSLIYNKNRKLVYEKKILKYNEYKKRG